MQFISRRKLEKKEGKQTHINSSIESKIPIQQGRLLTKINKTLTNLNCCIFNNLYLRSFSSTFIKSQCLIASALDQSSIKIALNNFFKRLAYFSFKAFLGHSFSFSSYSIKTVKSNTRTLKNHIRSLTRPPL